MKFYQSLSTQYENFFVFTGFGFLSGFFYDLLMLLRKMLSSKKSAWILQDVLFCISVSVSMYLLFLAYTNGEIRVILMASSVLGFVIYKLTVGIFISNLLTKLEKRISAFLTLALKPFVFVSAFLKKINLKLKKDLKCRRKSV